VAGLVEQIDLCPTLLAAAGVPVPRGVKGRDLLPLARGATEAGRPDVLTEYRDGARGFSAKTVRTPTFKLTRLRQGGVTTEVLFDLQRDPDEVVNVASDPAYVAAAAALRHRLLDRLQEAEDDLPMPISTA
jgi:arylsulfatase A-like enzyme